MAKSVITTTKKLEDIKDGTYVFQLTNKIIPTSPTAPPFQRFKQLAANNVTFDDDKKLTREIRVIEGMQTIFVDEQKLDKDIAEGRTWYPVFIDGVCTLNAPMDNLKILYMFKRNDYDEKSNRIGTKVVYTLANKTVDAKDILEAMDMQDKASREAMDATDIDAIKAHLMYLNVPIMDGFNQELSTVQLKIAYRQAAKANPAKFLKSLDNPAVEITKKVKEKIASSEIDLNKVKGQAHWGETGALITALDLTKDPVDFLVEFAASANGKEFLKKLQNSK